ncbi:hypothetical protein C1Y63_12115 [Corynebacterium sp. 13CS0277]|uniref:ATP-binding cassette domain-containing protein n=1 Tax=Corynebacterium sp. 13CS0277 TaxID=2071994 RepID=UPI000D031E0B|nr:ABC transporter ATP-binding protein [Corynebacterium sp. 13CS0277]PRQ10324.1 hypothetical protein C1Y63_12115 [Corynebacterium sp. 13CS0277]
MPSALGAQPAPRRRARLGVPSLLQWWLEAARRAPGWVAVLAVACVLAAVTGALVPVALGRAIDGLTAGAVRGTAVVVVLVAVLPMLLSGIVDVLAAELQRRLDVAARVELPGVLAGPASVSADSALDGHALWDDIRDWEFRDSVGYATTVTATRCASIVSFLIVARWNLPVACLVLAAFIAAGVATERWLVIDRDPHAPDEQVARAARAAGLRADTGEAIVWAGYGYLARMYADAARRAASAVAARRQRAVVWVACAGAGIGVAVGCAVWLLVRGETSAGGAVAILGGILGLAGAGPQGDAGVAVGSAARTLRALRSVPHQPGQVAAAAAGAPAAGAHAPVVALRGAVAGYPGGPDVLHGVDVAIAPGTFVGIVGPNGGGKSTLLHTLMGVLPLRAGTRHTPPELRQAAVFQDYARFPVPLAAHYALGGGRRTPAVDYDPTAGLSGGQWQRLALERALARDVDVLVLDEPNAALDAHADRALQAAVDEARRLRPTMAVVMVTHRLASLATADVIHVVEDGTIIDSGTHAELHARCALYRLLYDTQKDSFQ